ALGECDTWAIDPPSTLLDMATCYDPSRRRAPVHARPLVRPITLPRRYPRHITITALLLVVATVSVVATRTQDLLNVTPEQAVNAALSSWLTVPGVSSQPGHTTWLIDGQGIYDSCTPAAPACLAHLDTLAQGGFQLVINYSQFTPGVTMAQELAYAA